MLVRSAIMYLRIILAPMTPFRCPKRCNTPPPARHITAGQIEHPGHSPVTARTPSSSPFRHRLPGVVPLQLNVFHALRETCKDRDYCPRPEPAPSKRERRTKLRTYALHDFPVGKEVRRPFEGTDGVSHVALGRVDDFQTPYWRARWPDGDWERLSRREMTGRPGHPTRGKRIPAESGRTVARKGRRREGPDTCSAPTLSKCRLAVPDLLLRKPPRVCAALGAVAVLSRPRAT